MLITVVAGQPVMATSNFALVLVKVAVAVPAQVASASVIGGFSFEALRSALKTFATVGDGLGVGLAVGVGVETAAVPPQAATGSPRPRCQRIRAYSILLVGSSVYTAGRTVRMR